MANGMYDRPIAKWRHDLSPVSLIDASLGRDTPWMRLDSESTHILAGNSEAADRKMGKEDAKVSKGP